MKKGIAVVLIIGMMLCPLQTAWAFETPTNRAIVSALIPGVGQIMNDDHETGKGKAKITTMCLIELGAIITTPILYANNSYWYIGIIGPCIFLLNHAWSAYDAYQVAEDAQEAEMKGSNTR